PTPHQRYPPTSASCEPPTPGGNSPGVGTHHQRSEAVHDFPFPSMPRLGVQPPVVLGYVVGSKAVPGATAPATVTVATCTPANPPEQVLSVANAEFKDDHPVSTAHTPKVASTPSRLILRTVVI